MHGQKSVPVLIADFGVGFNQCDSWTTWDVRRELVFDQGRQCIYRVFTFLLHACIRCSAQQYFNNRLKYVDGLKSSGGTPYPHKFPVSTTLVEYVEAYTNLESGQQLQDTTVSVAGRL